MRDISGAEAVVCEKLAIIIAETPVGSSLRESKDLQRLLSALSWFIPEVLCETHDEWKYESLDGVFPTIAKRIAKREIEIIGAVCLITDQTYTPAWLRLQVAPTSDSISWCEIYVGEQTVSGMRREQFSSSLSPGHKLQVVKRFDSINWSYHVSYGDRV